MDTIISCATSQENNPRQNHRTISLMNQPSKVIKVFKVILDFRVASEEMLAKGHAGFRINKNSAEHILNNHILIRKTQH